MATRAIIKEILEQGQSIWYDYIRRDLMAEGELDRLIGEDGLRGMTSNPTIFDKAIAHTDLYDEAIQRHARQHPTATPTELFFDLAIEDIRLAADAFLGVYEQSEGRDGFVSLEVSPALARHIDGTVEEAKHLFQRVDRPNLMIKVPATREGLPAMRQLIAEGVNVNATLLFSVDRYRAVFDAYLLGIEDRVKQGLPVERIASVASLFVSRVDTAVDQRLDAHAEPEATALKGKIALANAKLAYAHFQDVVAGERFRKLEAEGAQRQRLLWASTSTKNPDYGDLYYVENLIGEDTVNTLPPATYEAVKDHGTARSTVQENVDEARAQLAALADLQIDLEGITDWLEADGVRAFAESFDHLLESLQEKRSQLAA